MSFVKKAVKKVFDFGKKVVKKVGGFVKRLVDNKFFRIAAIAALTFFTAGVASVGFAAFQGVSTVGGFFGAVGNTLAAGWSSVIGGLKAFGTGIKSALGFGAQATEATAATASSLGTASGTAAEAGIGGILSGGAETAGGSVLSAGSQAAHLASQALPMAGTAGLGETAALVTSQVTQSVAQTGAKNWLTRIGTSLFGNSPASTGLRSGISMGINWWLNNEQQEREWERRDNATVWLGPAFGGSAEAPSLLKPYVGDKDQEDQSVASKQSGQQVVRDQTQAPSKVSPTNAFMTAPQQAKPQNPENKLLASIPANAKNQPPPATQPQGGRSPANIRPELLGVT